MPLVRTRARYSKRQGKNLEAECTLDAWRLWCQTTVRGGLLAERKQDVGAGDRMFLNASSGTFFIILHNVIMRQVPEALACSTAEWVIARRSGSPDTKATNGACAFCTKGIIFYSSKTLLVRL